MANTLSWRHLGILHLAVLALASGSWPASAADEKAKEAREAAGKLASPAGTLLARKDGETSWNAPAARSELFSTDALLALPGSRAQVENAAVRLTLWGNLPEYSAYPLLESEVVLHRTSGVDLDLTLKRGRIVVERLGGDRAATVRVQFEGGDPYEVVLGEGAQAAFEKYSRWPSGTQFTMVPRNRRPPHSMLVVLALKVKVDLKIGGEQYLMQSPAAFQWDNVGGRDAKPNRAASNPAWAGGLPDSADARRMTAAVEKLQKALASAPVEKALDEELASSNPADRKLAVYAFAALDDLPRLADALGDAKRADVRADAIHALRHWLGQAGDNDIRLNRFLIKNWEYAPAQAETVVQLLLGLRDSDRDRPETYETLIEYLRHRKRSIRELARWTLYHWVIAGREIPYDAGASAAEHERAYKAWKQLIPDGKLPPTPPKPDGK